MIGRRLKIRWGRVALFLLVVLVVPAAAAAPLWAPLIAAYTVNESVQPLPLLLLGLILAVIAVVVPRPRGDADGFVQ